MTGFARINWAHQLPMDDYSRSKDTRSIVPWYLILICDCAPDRTGRYLVRLPGKRSVAKTISYGERRMYRAV